MPNIKNLKSLSLLLIVVLFVILFGCDKEVSTSPIDEKIAKAFLFIGSTPSGSAIFINNKNTGRVTPQYVPYLEEGQYIITLKRRYYRDTTFTVNLLDNDTTSIQVNYLSNPLMLGKINFTSSPNNANILINDSVTNIKTPALISGLLPGSYNVKYRYANHREAQIEVTVESNKTTAAYSVLRDTSVWVDFQSSNSAIQSNLLTSISVDNYNTKWIGTLNTGLINFNEIEFKNYNTANSQILSNQINCIAVNFDNSIWIGTNNGLSIYSNNSWRSYSTNNSDLPNDNVNSITFDEFGFAWIGTNNGFARFNGTLWQKYNYLSPHFEYLWVTDLTFDHSGNLWIGSNNFGVLKFNGISFEEFPDSVYSLLTDRITSLDVDNLNKVWIGQQLNSNSRGGISILNGTNTTNLFIGTNNNRVNNIYTHQYQKWVCTNEGIALYNENNSSSFFSKLNSYLSNDNVTGVVIDLNNNVWITTQGGGLNKYKSISN